MILQAWIIQKVKFVKSALWVLNISCTTCDLKKVKSNCVQGGLRIQLALGCNIPKEVGL